MATNAYKGVLLTARLAERNHVIGREMQAATHIHCQSAIIMGEYKLYA